MGVVAPLEPTVNLRTVSPVPASRYGKYRLMGELATGGMARVFLAAVEGPEGFVKPCVLKKVLPEFARLPDFTRMFIHEARIAALLNHPNIVQAFDFGEFEGEFFLALEFVEGASLSNVIRAMRVQNMVAPLPVALHVGISLCDALAYAHSARDTNGEPLNLVHRDVTPGNVLVSATGAVKLTDFGIVRSRSSARNSSAQMLKGKIAYIAPEQVRCEPVDGRADIFSLGLVLYELVTGKRPLSRKTFAEGLLAARAGVVPLPSSFMSINPEFERVLMRALCPDPADRYPNAKALQHDLEALRAQQSWTSGADALGSLLTTLFPGGFPNSARIFARGRAPAQEAEELSSADIEPVPTGDEASTPAPRTVPPSVQVMAKRRLRDFAWMVALGLAGSGALWLLVLP